MGAIPVSLPASETNVDAFTHVFGRYRGFVGDDEVDAETLPPSLLRFRRKDRQGIFRAIAITPNELAITVDFGHGNGVKSARLTIDPVQLRRALANPPAGAHYNDVDFGAGVHTRLWEINKGGAGERRFGFGINKPDAFDPTFSDGSCYVWLRDRDRDEALWHIRNYQPRPRERPRARLHLRAPVTTPPRPTINT
jgi:hypothetical protein